MTHSIENIWPAWVMSLVDGFWMAARPRNIVMPSGTFVIYIVYSLFTIFRSQFS
jgi:hypothetical protein